MREILVTPSDLTLLRISAGVEAVATDGSPHLVDGGRLTHRDLAALDDGKTVDVLTEDGLMVVLVSAAALEEQQRHLQDVASGSGTASGQGTI